MQLTNTTQQPERLIELSLAKKEYSGTATNYLPTAVSVSSLEEILTSHNYSPIIWNQNYRLSANFAYAVGFCMDIDNGMTIEDAEVILNHNNLNFVLITTKSHNADAHRFRVFIPFNKNINTFAQYLTAAHAINGLLGSKCDPKVFDGARQLYGSPVGSYFNSCWTGNDFDVTPYIGIDLSSVSSGAGDWNDNLIVRDKNGKEISVKDITGKTAIYCNWHDDHNPSAFIDYNKKSENWFIHCSSSKCNKTYWKTKKVKSFAEQSEHFWSHGSKIYEMGIIGDFYHFKEIGEKKYYSFVNAVGIQDKSVAFDWLLKNHHISNVIRIDYVGDPLAKIHSYEVKNEQGLIEVKFTVLPVEIQDNQFIDNYLQATFGQYKDFIKQYMAVYSYSDYKKLPTLILVGQRGVGKSKFAELMAEIYPQRSQFWTASQESFNSELQKKLLIADETVSSDKKNYLYLKRISGQNHHLINEKFTPKYQVKNNVNVIILSNNLLPIFVEREELPTSQANNQFFVYEIKPFTGNIDAQFAEKLKARLGYYIRTELKQVFDKLDLSKNRYSVPVPITPEEHKLFKSSVTVEQMNADKFLEELINKYTGTLVWDLYEFVKSGYVPVDAICTELQISKQDKRSIVHSLRERDYLSSSETQRLQTGIRREYCYLMTDKLKAKIERDKEIACCAQNAREQQARKVA